MATFKSSDWKEVKFNGQDVTKIILNGTTVWEKIKHYIITVTGTSGSKKLNFGYSFSITETIHTNASNVEITSGTACTYGPNISYEPTTGKLNVNGYVSRANSAVSFTVEYDA